MNQKIIPLVSIVAGLAAFSLTYKYLRDKDAEVDRIKAEIYRSARTISATSARSVTMSPPSPVVTCLLG